MTKDVKLISYDGIEYIVPEEIATQSSTLKSFLDEENPFIESHEKTVVLPIKSNILKRVIDYLKYKYEYKDTEGTIPDFEIKDDETLELLDVSSYLRI
ncbi:hypothetical protein CWI38_0186p0050 [Hamiltosporidium tvaerminnensis]|uniref:Elongin-C n=2 Tax=Hamiltosporidium TaxID=1176354 RepID=A0A4Q9LL22_9MICR|nr:Transcription elongation factor B (SIII), polypeptide 1 (15kDa, elongin C) [Hamiltosporidium tvaerminnensis]TBU05198.1 hypothetical protein CWI39_0707p0020 [Hamiltosporidium magnivora]TBU08924.1 hypothetical protein CWI36_0083p0050 [Hamiltosporidium magnivora]TBU13257.1 hypothetical protein CWI38_0486p0010 [Hamiltosporidium tvaerminnensis]TBU19854.1 hypothetical protein CWI38_0186p0050 [Hamiltosporidium tvaerminnensis]